MSKLREMCASLWEYTAKNYSKDDLTSSTTSRFESLYPSYRTSEYPITILLSYLYRLPLPPNSLLLSLLCLWTCLLFSSAICPIHAGKVVPQIPSELLMSTYPT